MKQIGVWHFRLSRLAGRFVTRLAAIMTLGRMPPFVSASVLVVDKSRILAIIDPIRDEPVLPGGHLKWTEQPSEAAVREVREETGYVVELGRLVGVFAGEGVAGEKGVVRVIYEGRILTGQAASSPEGEVAWLSLDGFARSASRDAPIVAAWLEKEANASHSQ